MRKANQESIFFVETIDGFLSKYRAKDIDSDASRFFKYTVVGGIEGGFFPATNTHDHSRISLMFSGVALVTLGQAAVSEVIKSEDIIRCLDDLEKCGSYNKDPLVILSFGFFEGLLMNDSNQDILNSLTNPSRLRWSIPQESSYRFFDPEIDKYPPSFNHIE